MRKASAASRQHGTTPLALVRHTYGSSTIDVGALGLATIAVFWPVLRNGFVNWDDPAVLIGNPRLGSPGVVAWAFTTTLIGHYQPLAWLLWSAAKSLFGLSATAFHGLSLAGHIVNGFLVYAVSLRLAEQAQFTPIQRRAAAVLAACVFLVHPTQVEVVAWASALPYVLSLTMLLGAFWAYLDGRPIVSIGCYATSLLIRASAIGFPLALLVVDIYPLERRRRTSLGRLALEKIPFAVLAGAAAIVEVKAREIASFQEVGIGARLTMAVTAPFVYLGRTLLPLRLSPLHPLPISPALELFPLVLGITGLVTLAAVAWTLRRRWPLIAVACVTYAVLLAPVAGLTPSGLQATADRYLYGPSVVIAIATGMAVARLPTPGRRTAAATVIVAAAVLLTLGVLTWRQTQYWRDSVALWTRAAEIDPQNDIATYNLAIALVEAGREDEAVTRYEQTLRLVPDHDLARRNLTLLQGAHAEREADRLAAEGRLNDAAEGYTRALSLDPNRLHARAARGILLARNGRYAEAAADLRVAFDADVKDAEVPNTLAFALMQAGQFAEAAAVLKRAIAQHPENVNLTHNLARLLATSPDQQVRDGTLALRLALDVRERTGGRDPRALDTLAAAYAAVGRLDMARETSSQAAALARKLGDLEAANELDARARSYRR
jgi:Flp pilus assembly protein TadD